MIRELLEHIPGISSYPVISMIIFILLFVGIVYWAVKVNKSYIKKMEELPLDSSNSITNNGEQKDG